MKKFIAAINYFMIITIEIIVINLLNLTKLYFYQIIRSAIKSNLFIFQMILYFQKFLNTFT